MTGQQKVAVILVAIICALIAIFIIMNGVGESARAESCRDAEDVTVCLQNT